MKQWTVALLFAGLAFAVMPASAAPADRDDVMKVDEQYRIAKLTQDVGNLNRILADQFNETNQNGNSRNKTETLALWKTFRIDSLTTDSADVRVAGDTATVTGTQTEDRDEHMLFTRVYVRRQGAWQLLSSMQFRSAPNRPEPIKRTGPEGEVMAAEEAYRTAKLRRDAGAIERVLADNFYGVNQWGHWRNKSEVVDLWKDFSVNSLITDTAEVRINGDTAVVLGTQTEDGDHMLFTRVWVKGSAGWQLVSSMQYLNPKVGTDR